MRLVTVLSSIALLLAACSSSSSDTGDRPGNSGTGSSVSQDPSSPPGASSSSGSSGDGATPPGDPPPPPPSPPKVAVTTEALDVAGVSRSFVLAVPLSHTPSKTYPLALVLHGDGGDGPSMRAATRMDDVTGEAAIVAYPTGTQNGWRLYQPPADNPDLAFLTALVGSLRDRFNVDPSRVFATGFSSGGFMANQIACRQPTLFRAIASHGGGAPDEPQDPSASWWPNGFVQCAGQSSGVAALVVHGADDGVVVYASGEHTARYWAYVNGCETTKTPAVPAPCVRHTGCPGDRPVVFCGIPGLGHSLWSAAMKTSWDFFASFAPVVSP
jgi:polyhydroxybutyrate depolymerase